MARRFRQTSGPLALRTRGWWRALRRTVAQFQALNLGDRAAALTYYGMLSIFPMLIVLVALLGLLGQHPQTTDALLNIVDRVAPPSTVETLKGPIEGVVKSKGGAGALFGAGLIVSLWSASGYIGGFMRASNEIYEVQEGRSFWHRRPLQIVMTLAVLALLVLVSIALVLTGDLAQAIGEEIGLGNSFVDAWSIARWPLLMFIVTSVFAVLYYVAPDVEQHSFRWITPGGVLALLLWLAASAGFAIYVSLLGQFNKTYGSLAAVIVFLVWLWLSNIALLLGELFNAELERT